MNLTNLGYIVQICFLAGAAMFVLGLHLMNSPATARRGNRLSALGMLIVVVSELLFLSQLQHDPAHWLLIGVGLAIGGGFGLWIARGVAMTSIPQLVSLFNAVGGGAAALLAISDFFHRTMDAGTAHLDGWLMFFIVVDVIIGAVTFTGSLVASSKLQGLIRGQPIVIPGGRIGTAVAVIVGVGLAVVLVLTGTGTLHPEIAMVDALFLVVLLCALVFGITMVLPIGGADMPVVISLLNAFTGTAVAMAGFVLSAGGLDFSAAPPLPNVGTILIIAGALVGASGAILTKLMASAMNRSLANIIVGGFGAAEGTQTAAAALGGTVRQVSVDDAAIQLAYSQKVIVVPGYGLAVAQAQHGVRELADLLEARGIEVSYAIHPVAGRMPGHMNVLLAEANVPYPQLREMDEINPEFERTDVALVIGANDVTNPSARENKASPIYGMPILNVDRAKSIIVIKRSMGRGYAGIDNPLYTNPKTSMLFEDAKKGTADLIAAIKAL